ncbi:hypothetical protein OX283_013970 [Flavobacterium sp. SUN052]|uniref:hypothetical protein n=1 Tax=Flavobacterium sp. SUN052 TaxID=3002441 RepID=UPI00237E479B|nr:hypothetical protein [Flavobacterium sp. SUN052]MEC4005774.1 hypothetical protein [Flavobacterium sp. SUN052]
MKRSTLNQYSKIRFFLIETIKINRFSLIILLFLLISFSSFSQANQRTPIFEKNNFLTTLRTSSSTTPAVYNRVASLFKDVNSSIYLSNNQVNTIGNRPLCMFTDVTSLSVANNPNLLVNDVELVTIKIDNPSTLNAPINLSVVSRYHNVKYIYFKVSFDFQISQLLSHLLEVDPKVVLIYSVDKRS